MSLFVRYEIVGLFVKDLIINDIYPGHTMENFPQPVQMHVSKKPKRFLDFPLYFWNLHQIFNMLKKKN